MHRYYLCVYRFQTWHISQLLEVKLLGSCLHTTQFGFVDQHVWLINLNSALLTLYVYAAQIPLE